jgi:DNA polymerase-3 subunit beta
MKFKIRKDVLQEVLGNIQGLTGRKSNLAITSTVLIRSDDSGIIIEATDLETGFRGTYPAEVESTGAIAINSRKLFEIVRDFPSDDVQIHEVENYWIEIGNKNVEYHLVGMNPEDYPDIPQIDATSFFEIDASAFKKMIERTLMTGIFEDTRAHITGILFEKIEQEDSKIVRMVSTDGSRLSLVDYFFGSEFENVPELNLIVPKKGLHEVSKFLEPEKTVHVGVKDNHLIMKKDSETVIMRLLEGDFPKYEDVINQESTYRIKTDKQMFMMMLRRMSILSSEEYKGVIFKFADNKLNINSTNPEIGESKEDMTIDFEGEPIEVMFNPKFFIDTLNVVDDETVIVNITDETKPCLLKGVDDNSFVSVIMPMRI